MASEELFFFEDDDEPDPPADAPPPAVPPPALARPAAYLLLADAQWTPADLRDYVVSEIEQREGPATGRDPAVEMSIFKAFAGRWGALGPAIARHAFTVCDGWWRGSPVTVKRFCKNCDKYFATPIADLLPGGGR